MPSDQLHHKRKARTAASLKRKIATRSPYERVLIVCEGKKTEPNYFRALVADLRLNTANIRIVDNTAGPSPITVVDFALAEYKKDGEYDRVYCVFDKDQHSTYRSALDKIQRARLGRGHVLLATTSVPCFEVWLLLHFTYTTKQFDTGPGSFCAMVIRDLKAFLPSYAKGVADVYQETKTRLDDAIANAKKMMAHCATAGTEMPSTHIHELVAYLRTLNRN